MTRLPFALVLLRLLLAPVMLCWAYQTHRTGWFLVACLWAGLVSDIFDGIIARRLGVATDALRKWDAWVDLVFWLAAGVCIWMLNGRLLQTHVAWIVLLFVLEPVSDLINFIKFRKSGCAHNWLSKLWGILLLITFTILLAGGAPVLLFRICLGLGVASMLDRILISSLLPKPECDIPSFYQAYLRRKGKTFKRYKMFN
ncbi:CDP-alcohol phosphatidyltransferase family protein [Dinghuibacter silviterrae]|uniref:CDP-alcohol phosphatidyltransferase family protein n=1 Tax=Dinghuibacter silviterrae TaxID=1539049 RepID=UPI0013C2D132|nr:CDP-alcohol phosphatidyltransferase family protein [Dinghuibacter silviterrae]